MSDAQLATRLTELASLISELKGQDTPGNYGSGGVLFGNAAGKATTDTTFVWNDTNNWLGVGTTTPTVKLTLGGTSSSYGAGPHIEHRFTGDANPVFQFLGFSHDNMELTFDGWYDGAQWISSDLGSNYQIRKNGDLFSIWSDSAITPGNVISWDNILTIGLTGILNLPGSARRIQMNGVNVLGNRITGYTNAMTGTANRATAYATGTITLVQLAERVKAIEDDLLTHGLIGT